MLQLIIKISISLLIIVFCSWLSRKLPTLAGLISVMPLTGLLVLILVYLDNNGDRETMIAFTKASCWGILPSVLFFLAALLCFKAGWKLWPSVAVGSVVWIIGACVHQYFMNLHK